MHTVHVDRLRIGNRLNSVRRPMIHTNEGTFKGTSGSTSCRTTTYYYESTSIDYFMRVLYPYSTGSRQGSILLIFDNKRTYVYSTCTTTVRVLTTKVRKYLRRNKLTYRMKVHSYIL